MKLYFTMYFPVQGQVKDKDVIFDKDNLKFGRITYPDNADGIYHVDYLDGSIGGCDHFELVKLFLCSKDLKVGDDIKKNYGYTVRNSKILKQRADGLVKLDGYYEWHDLSKLSDNGFFKVIGEVSPEATWVKEGDEFNKDDWNFAWFKPLYGKMRKTHNYEPSDDVLSMFKEGDFQKLVQIKGSCGHFH